MAATLPCHPETDGSQQARIMMGQSIFLLHIHDSDSCFSDRLLVVLPGKTVNTWSIQ